MAMFNRDPRIPLRKRREKAERRFQLYGKAALGIATLALVFLLITIIGQGYSGFKSTEIRLTVAAGPAAGAFALLADTLVQRFPEATERLDRRELVQLFSQDASRVLEQKLKGGGEIGTLWLKASDMADRYIKSNKGERAADASIRLSAKQKGWLQALEKTKDVRTVFNSDFFRRGDSRSPEQAGFLGSMIGSLLTLLTCIGIAFPLGVLAAVYLEEFAPKSRFVDIIEVNINNLAAVPSIVFGLLGLAVFLGVFGMPRSASLVGGITLSLMILPTIIITTRASLKAVPDSIRDAARGLGASPIQVVFHHTVPLAMPGIMTGAILGMARAIGETAPLLMIGMVAFVADVPKHFTDPATVMPVQIYLWASSPEISFVEKTAAGIMVLLVMLLLMNSLAIIIRKRFEQRW